MKKRRVVGRIYGVKYSRKGHKDRNRHENSVKGRGQARLVYVKNVNRNIQTTWRWARGHRHDDDDDCGDDDDDYNDDVDDCDDDG